jgi:peptidyl-prolyl cis-trans isomerase SurA
MICRRPLGLPIIRAAFAGILHLLALPPMTSVFRRAFAAFVLGASLSLWQPATRACAQDQGIAAIVNDDIISSHDLESRIALFLATSNAQDTPENRRRLAPEVLRTLIDDVLKRQEMRRQNITVSQAEIDRALAQIAAQLRVQPEQLADYLASRGVAMSTLIDQLEAEIGWLKAVTRITGDRAVVSPEEVDEEMARMRGSGVQYRVAEIFLAVDDPADQPRVEGLASRLATEARGGANFAALARTFSQSPSATVGGDLGWMQRDELDVRTEAVLSRLQPGQVSDPIRAQGGYLILYLVDRRPGEGPSARNTTVTLQQVFLPIAKNPTDAELSAKAKTARDMAQSAHSCSELEARSAQSGGAALSRNLGKVDVQQLPPDVQRAVLPLGPGESTAPVRVSEGFVMLMVCDRQVEDVTADQRAAVERRVRDQRLSATARRQLRDLRRGALLDIRL